MSDDKPDTCPICDQPYINRLDVYQRLSTPSVRQDFVVCRQPKPHGSEWWYVHDRNPRVSIARSERKRPEHGLTRWCSERAKDGATTPKLLGKQDTGEVDDDG